jgi:radical SAM superfamily enzyme YgiQ (UPF0313 family)
MKICTSQYSNFFGNKQIYFPYACASIIAYCLTSPEIKEKCSFSPIFLFKDHLNIHIEEARDADILLCSCYAWNWEITKTLAKTVKENNPNCLVVFGGPQIPNNHKSFFKEHPYVDILIHGEGEIAVSMLIQQVIDIKSIGMSLDLVNLTIDGAETRHKRNGYVVKVKDLSILPSPYTSNLIWDLLPKTYGINYLATWETNRGCPFSCTFCDWGASTANQLRKFPEQRVLEEAEWFGENKIIYVECCDSNFGIFLERDTKIASKISEVKEQYGFPEKVNLVWVKTSSDRIIPLAKRLAKADLLRSISLSIQSFYPKTLEAIKRKNVEFDVFEDLIKKFSNEGLPSYTELIMGLPEETLDSFKNSWDMLASIYPLPMVLVWNCGVFPNAPMNDEAYRKKYNIETFRSPMFMRYSSKPKTSDIQEYQYMVKSTASLDEEEMREMYAFNWIMMVFHAFGLFEYVARFFHREKGWSYREFYERFIDYCIKNPNTLFGKEYQIVEAHAKNGFSGKPWDYYDDTIGDISWTMEEAGWLHLTRSKDVFKQELRAFIGFLIGPQIPDVVENLLGFQIFLINFPDDRGDRFIEYNVKYQWIEYFSKNSPLTHYWSDVFKLPPSDEMDRIKWGYDVVWFGGRKKKVITKLDQVYSNK